jgi:hypothetical protein
MKADKKGRATSFLAAAGAIGLAGVLTRACPGACTSCATCASTLLPMGASAAAVGVALVSSAGVRARRRERESDGSQPGG